MAIVGSGCTGIGALYALKNTDHDVHLFEADEVLGGHTNTDKWKHDGKEVNVDTGFIVYNTATYRKSFPLIVYSSFVLTKFQQTSSNSSGTLASSLPRPT